VADLADSKVTTETIGAEEDVDVPRVPDSKSNAETGGILAETIGSHASSRIASKMVSSSNSSPEHQRKRDSTVQMQRTSLRSEHW
jgi:hypothetical protein